MQTKPKKPRKVLRLAPCPAYDVQGTESWLQDQAKEGYFLSQDGFFGDIAVFVKDTPKACAYRLQASEKSTSMWAENYGDPSDTQLMLHEHYGWEYVGKRGQFYVFRSLHETAREPNTDLQVQALTIKEVRKRRRSAMFTSIFWAFIYPVFVFRGAIVMTMIAIRSWFFLLLMLDVLIMVIDRIREVVSLTALIKRLEKDLPLQHSSEYRKLSKRYRVGKLVRECLSVFCIISAVVLFSGYIMEEDAIPLQEYKKDPPFHTMADIFPDGQYELENYGFSNTVYEYSDWLAPQNFDYSEIATVISPDGHEISGGLYVDYHETRYAFMARRIAKEYLRLYQIENRSFAYTPLQLDMDFAVYISSDRHSPRIIVQHENRVMTVMFYQTSEHTLTTEEWIEFFGLSIR